jgi:hypothetical protein
MVAAVGLQQLADTPHDAHQDQSTVEPLTVEHPEPSVGNAYWMHQPNALAAFGRLGLVEVRA